MTHSYSPADLLYLPSVETCYFLIETLPTIFNLGTQNCLSVAQGTRWDIAYISVLTASSSQTPQTATLEESEEEKRLERDASWMMGR